MIVKLCTICSSRLRTCPPLFIPTDLSIKRAIQDKGLRENSIVAWNINFTKLLLCFKTPAYIWLCLSCNNIQRITESCL